MISRASTQPQRKQTVVARVMSDDRGALVWAGLFMMLVSVSMLYFFLGVAETLQAREGMQDAADASAFAAAVFMARGMNLIALINLLMAALVAILVAIRLMQTFLQVSAALLFAGAWWFGSTVPAAQACQTGATSLGNAYEQAKDPILQVVEVLHDVQEATSVVIPFVALGAGMVEAAHHHPPAQGAFALPAPDSLPVESDEFPVLCAHATDIAVTGAVDQFASFLGEPARAFADKLMTPVEKAAKAVGQATSAYLCGEGGSAPPKYSFDTEKVFPEPEDAEACNEDTENERCKSVIADWEASNPDPVTGECTNRCGYEDPYETQARRARSDCEPGVNGYAEEYKWQSVSVETSWLYENGQWRPQEHELDNFRLETSKHPPCGFMGSLQRDAWNRDSGDRDREHPVFLCSNQPQPNVLSPTEGQRWSSPTYRAALRVFSCVFEKEETVDTAEESQQFGGEGDEDKSPHRMQNVELGSETFQVRAVAFGPPVGPGQALEDGVGVGLRERESPALSDTLFEVGEAFNRFSIAQAEYFYDGDENTPREDWLWEMRWRARLVRFRLPTDEEQDQERERQEQSNDAVTAKLQEFGGTRLGDSFEEVCTAVTSECPTQTELAEFAGLVIH